MKNDASRVAPQGDEEVNLDSAGRLRQTAPISGDGTPLPGSAPARRNSVGTKATNQATATGALATPQADSDTPEPTPHGELDDEHGKKRQKRTASTKPQWSTRKKVIVALIVILLLAGIITGLVFLFLPKSSSSNTDYTSPEPEKIYSTLTGEEILNPALNTSPTYCLQIPNGTDISPRTHVGLQYAGVVFEAIAEAGITRFAAVFQNTDTSMIGPIRSLRTYYLDWDTPFDCTIVHAGGADDALAALKRGNYRDLTESTTYMWRNHSTYRSPNNLFTSSQLLNDFNQAHGYTTSNLKGFPRLTPDETNATAAENLRKATEGDAIESVNDQGETVTETVTTPLVESARLNFGRNANYNLVYTYNRETNSYDRAYANGNAHWSYNCGSEETNPANCTREQLSPKVVIAMIVEERRASDGYHEDVTSLGSGTAYVFQNGTLIQGTWHKASAADQIQFLDTSGQEIKLAAGQTWISAIPTYGSVEY